SWERKYLYLNVALPPEVEKKGRKYQFQFKGENPESGTNEYWYRVGDILEADDAPAEAEEVIDKIRDAEGIDESLVKSHVYNNIQRLHNAIIGRDAISYFQETDEDRDKILDIFIRANDGGTQLSKSDLLLSVATAQWSGEDEDEDIVARDEIKKLVDELNSHNARKGVEFDANFVLRALLTTSDISNLSFTLSNFDKDTLAKMKETWKDPEFERSLFAMLDLLDSYGLTTSNVRSKMIHLPVVYYYYDNGVPTLSYGSKHGRETRKKILYWMASLVVNGDLNTGGTVQTIRGVRDAISDADQNIFPIQKIESKLNDYNKSMGFSEETLNRWFGGDNQSGYQNLRMVLSILYFPDIANENYSYEI
ncbi:MAG: hypothetical protein ABEI13_00575, partial [Candidatus Paceibacteria bacterium]